MGEGLFHCLLESRQGGVGVLSSMHGERELVHSLRGGDRQYTYRLLSGTLISIYIVLWI